MPYCPLQLLPKGCFSLLLWTVGFQAYQIVGWAGQCGMGIGQLKMPQASVLTEM